MMVPQPLHPALPTVTAPPPRTAGARRQAELSAERASALLVRLRWPDDVTTAVPSAVSTYVPGDATRCLGAVLDACGWQGDVRTLRDALPEEHAGSETAGTAPILHLAAALDVLAALGFETTGRHCTTGTLAEADLPALYVPADPALPLLALLGTTPEGVRCYDPQADAEAVRTCAALQRGGGGTLYPVRLRQVAEDAALRHARRQTGKGWTAGLVERFRGAFVRLLGVSACIHVVGLAVPLFVMAAYDTVVAAHAPHAMPMLLAGVTLALVVECVLRLARARALAWYGSRLGALAERGIVERLLALPPRLTEGASTAAQIARLRALESLRNLASGSLTLTLVELPFVAMLLGIIALISGPLALVPLTVAVLYVLLCLALRQRLRLGFHRAARAMSEWQQSAVETYAKLPALRAGGLTTVWRARLTAYAANAARTAARTAMDSALIEQASHTLAMLGGVAMVAGGMALVWEGSLSVGGLVACMILSWRVLNPLQTLCGLFPRLEQVRHAVAQTDRLMSLPAEAGMDITAQERAAAHPPLHCREGSLSFHHTAMRYERQGEPLFQGLTLEVMPGELVAVAGPNGSGKSTVLKLAAGLYLPAGGTVRVDGVDVRQYPPQQLRRSMGYLGQTADFFEGSILAHLRLNAPLASRAEVQAALEQADALHDVLALPQGLDTVVHPTRFMPSGSLAVRLHLARLYLSTAQLLLVDELPNTVLNSRAGEQFRAFLSGCRGARTVLYVCQRTDLAALADRMVLLRPEQRPLVGAPPEVIPHMQALFASVGSVTAAGPSTASSAASSAGPSLSVAPNGAA